jgi:hypothetical protein
MKHRRFMKKQRALNKIISTKTYELALLSKNALSSNEDTILLLVCLFGLIIKFAWYFQFSLVSPADFIHSRITSSNYLISFLELHVL